MTFTKATAIGFATGFAVALAISCIKVERPAFLVSADRKEYLSKKEALAKINDAVEDREILFALMMGEPVILSDEWELVKLKALTEPRWAKIVERINAIMGENE